ncbi:MAG TPA: hypothetical protein VNO22_12935 [Planctomycetota bacterium]|nr:hypothetical protein [Planctomycetota bacterium]
MKPFVAGLLAILGLAGCVVHVHERRPAPPPPPPPPPPPAPVVVVQWTHVRYVVWTEYYGCSDDEVAYLESCGYDDDDLLVLCFIARRARVPVRYVVYEYDRCGRSLYTVAMVFRLDPFVFYCEEVPRGYACPPPYGRAYGYYWRRQPVFLSNDECRALVQLHIGVRYYGYTSVAYFQEFERCRQRGEPPFRTIVVRDHAHAGKGGRTCDDRPVVKRDRPWEHRDLREWERRRQEERERMKEQWARRHKEEEERIRREAEAQERRRAAEEARRKAEELRRQREEEDRRGGGPAADRGPRRPDDVPGEKDAHRPPGQEGRGPGGPDREEGPRKPPGPPAGGKDGAGPGKKDNAGPKAEHEGSDRGEGPKKPADPPAASGGKDGPRESGGPPAAKPGGPPPKPAEPRRETPPAPPPSPRPPEREKAPSPPSKPAEKKDSGGDSKKEEKKDDKKDKK